MVNFQKKKLNIIFFLIHFLLLCYLSFYSKIYLIEHKISVKFIIYIYLLIITFLSGAFIFLENKKFEKIILLIFSIYFALYLAEAGLLILQEINEHTVKKEKEKISSVEQKSKFEYFLQKKKSGSYSLQFAPLDHTEILDNEFIPLGGKSNSLTIYCNESGYFSEFLSDRYGFNNPDEEWDKDNIKYLFFGDSFTHGACVNRPNDIPSNFRGKIKENSSVINLGWGGDGPLLQLAKLREYANLKKIENIIWIYYEYNDFADLENELKIPLLIKYFDKKFSQELSKNQLKIDKIIEDFISKKEQEYKHLREKDKKIELFRFIKLFKTRYLVQSFFIEEATIKKNNIEKFKIILKEVKNFSEENEIQLHFVYLPSFYRFKYDLDSNFKNYNLLKKIMLKEGNLIDLKQIIEKNKIDYVSLFQFGRPNHFSIDGYKKIADLIYKELK